MKVWTVEELIAIRAKARLLGVTVIYFTTRNESGYYRLDVASGRTLRTLWDAEVGDFHGQEPSPIPTDYRIEEVFPPHTAEAFLATLPRSFFTETLELSCSNSNPSNSTT